MNQPVEVREKQEEIDDLHLMRVTKERLKQKDRSIEVTLEDL